MTKIQICNMALLRVGGQVISDLTEKSREAQMCNVFYDPCLSQVIRKFPWSFAKKCSSLALLTDDPPTNWGFAYALPVDCIQVQRVIIPGARITRSENEIPFSVMLWAGVRALVCDVQEVEIEYTAQPDESFFDPLFCTALAWLLASEIANPLMGKPDLAQSCKTAYFTALGEAAAEDLNEGSDKEPECDFVAVRGISGLQTGANVRVS